MYSWFSGGVQELWPRQRWLHLPWRIWGHCGQLPLHRLFLCAGCRPVCHHIRLLGFKKNSVGSVLSDTWFIDNGIVYSGTVECVVVCVHMWVWCVSVCVCMCVPVVSVCVCVCVWCVSVCVCVCQCVNTGQYVLTTGFLCFKIVLTKFSVIHDWCSLVHREWDF